MLHTPPASVLRAMGEYEECLSLAQREYRRLAAAKGPARDAAARDYERAIARAREVAHRVRAAYDGHAA